MLQAPSPVVAARAREFVLMESEEAASDAVAQAVGERVKYWRTERGLLMRELADAAGMKQPFLSKIESGNASPSMLSLYRIATALNITPGDLLPAVAPQPGATVIRAEEGRIVAGTEQSSVPVRLVGGSEQHSFEISEMEFTKDQNNNEWFDYPSPAATYLIEGQLNVIIEGDTIHRLKPRDTIFYPARIRSKWEAVGDETVRVLHIVTRPRQA